MSEQPVNHITNHFVLVDDIWNFREDQVHFIEAHKCLPDLMNHTEITLWVYFGKYVKFPMENDLEVCGEAVFFFIHSDFLEFL